MTEKISISKTSLKEIQNELKQQGYSMPDISSKIGTNFSNCLYNGTKLNKTSFRKLEELYGNPIPHKIVQYRNGVSYGKRITKMEKSEDLAEFTGILLGDGYLGPGNKTENQVGVPDWIKENKQYTRSCLKGLIDTDGTIYQRSHDNYRVIQFKNTSKPLLEDFKEMCGNLDISTSK